MSVGACPVAGYIYQSAHSPDEEPSLFPSRYQAICKFLPSFSTVKRSLLRFVRAPRIEIDISRCGVLGIERIDDVVVKDVGEDLGNIIEGLVDGSQRDGQIPIQEEVTIEVLVIVSEGIQQRHGHFQPAHVEDELKLGRIIEKGNSCWLE